MDAPRATYRVQLHKDFRFADAATLVPYLAAIGFSHLYVSPIMAARSGSTHGYDVIDHNRLNPELGTEAEFEALVDALHAQGMGLIVDIVPNHVGIGPDNAAWMEVLEWGQASSYAGYFDIDWNSSRRNLAGKVLLPVLGDHFGAVLERGEITLRLDHGRGSISGWYYDNRLPISPLHYERLLAPALGRLPPGAAATHALATLVRDFAALREYAGSDAALRDGAASLKVRLAELVREDADARAAVEAALADFGGRPGDAASWEPLGRLLDEQAYRPAYWRVSADEINYRRFFDVNDLAGLRVEREELFEQMHRKLFELIEAGRIDGLRVDHIDGLFDPAQYLRRLQQRTHGRGAPFYIVLEKILAPHEELPEDWPVAGTTGYDALNLVGGLFVDPESERPLSALYRRFTRRSAPFDEVLYESKKHILQYNLASEVGVLANAVQTLSAGHWRSRDHSYATIRRALEELIARFPVYRTYLDRDARLSAADRRHIAWAVGLAKKHAGPIETSAFDFLERLLTGELAQQGYPQEDVLAAAMRFQQLSGPAMAKGVEDTAFYRYCRLLAHNEVGGDPRRYAVTPAAFHRANELRLKKRPLDMLAGSTHDTKRGEDARLRIACLSGVAAEWGRALMRWSRANRRLLSPLDGATAPDRNHQLYFYQTLIGAWPVELAPDDAAGLDELAARVEAAMIKALREGKERSSWTHPNIDYERAVGRFVRGALDIGTPNPFIGDFHAFVRRIAWLGALSSLSYTLLRYVMPGVPDCYRGAEGWELSMVDPDNRRPLDYGNCRQRLAGLDGASPEALLEAWRDGRIKLYVIRQALALRREHPGLFASGACQALEAGGTHAAHLIALRRLGEDGELVALAPRLWPRLLGAAERPDWRDTAIVIPPGRWFDVLSGRCFESDGARALSLAELLESLPVGLLQRRG